MTLTVHKKSLIIYFIFLIAATVFASFFGGPVAYGLLYGTLLLLPLSIFYTASNYWFLRVYQEIEVYKLVRGETHQYRLIIENAGLLPIYKMGIYTLSDRCRLYQVKDGMEINLGVHEKYEIKSGIICNFAGAYNVGVQTVSLSDPFGIYTVVLDIPYSFRAIVKPPITDMANKSIEIENLFNSTGLKSESQLEEIPGSDIRPYEKGDSLHAINWKVSAKLNELVVRVPERMEKQAVTMLLLADESIEDTEGKYTLEATRRRDFFLEFIVSAAWHFGQQQVPVRFIYPSGEVAEFTVNSRKSFTEFYSIVADGIFYNSKKVEQDLRQQIINQEKGVYEKNTWIIVRENPKDTERFCTIC